MSFLRDLEYFVNVTFARLYQHRCVSLQHALIKPISQLVRLILEKLVSTESLNFQIVDPYSQQL